MKKRPIPKDSARRNPRKPQIQRPSHRTRNDEIGAQSGDRPRSDRPNSERGGYGDRPPRGDRPQGERGSYGDRPRFDRPNNERGGYGDRPPRGDRPQGERGSYGDRPRFNRPNDERGGYGDRPPRGDRPQGERGSYGDRPRFDRPNNERGGYGDRPPRGDRPQGERGSYGDRPRFDRPNNERGGYGDRPPRGDRPQGERGSYGDRPRFDRPNNEGGGYGDRAPRGDRPQGERGSYGDRPRFDRPNNERGSYGDRPPRGDRPQGERGSYGDRPRFDRPNNEGGGYGDRPPRGDRPQGERGNYGDRPRFDRPQGERGSYGDRPRPTGPYKDREGFADRGERGFSAPNKKKRKHADKITDDDGMVRLNRFIALSGLCSRRKADEWIEDGRVKVNDRTVKLVGTKVNPNIDRVEVNGAVIKPEKSVYILMNKPKNHLTTVFDPDGRPTVMDLLHGLKTKRVYPVGRLDRNTTGVLLLTNDGDLAKRLMHPSYQIPKVYRVRLDQPFKEDHLKQMKSGIKLEDGAIRADRIAYSDRTDDPSEVLIELHSGRNRIVRRMFEHFGYTIVSLDRMMYGSLTKKGVERGTWRYLTDQEVGFLKMSADPEKSRDKPRQPRPKQQQVKQELDELAVPGIIYVDDDLEEDLI